MSRPLCEGAIYIFYLLTSTIARKKHTPTGHFPSGPSSDPSARHLLVRPGTSVDSILELWIKCGCGDLRVRVSVRVSQPHIRRSAFYPSRLLGRQISSVVEIEGEKRRQCVIYILKFRRRTNIFQSQNHVP